MEMKQKTVLLSVLLLIFGFVSIQAQEALAASGGEATGSGGAVSYTVGQAFYVTHSGTTGSLAEGVQQPIEISVVVGIDKPGITLNISAYPNPTTNILYLEVDASFSQNNQSLRYQLFDLSGRMLASEEIVNDVTTIVTSQLNPATYFVKVLGDDKELKTFKVIKY
jgi:hypothetical protein